MARVLVACEFSGVVRRAFSARGHEAWSCDLLPSEDGSTRHIIGDVRHVLADGWDLLIAHPPCTRLCNSGVRWLSSAPTGRDLADMWRELELAADLFAAIWAAPVGRVAIENPVMHGHAKKFLMERGVPSFHQTIQPWQFGHGEVKRTCFWLRGLPLLVPTHVVDGRVARVHRERPSEDRWKNRSRTFDGIAFGMAAQWGDHIQANVEAA